MIGKPARFFSLLPVLPLALTAACAVQSVGDYAASHRMTVREVEGDGFTHMLIERAGAPSGRLHVYIEGDGIPWSGNLPSRDPTPHNTLALRLAGQDGNDIAYLGRPCYFGHSCDAHCHPMYWTSHRYGEEVLASMAAAIVRTRLPRHTGIVLIGYSGGGALAALLESRVEGVVGVITVAANLDTDAWTNARGYDPLAGSLNPIRQQRSADILHLQFVGGRDTTVPAASSAGYAGNQPNVEIIEFAEFDHVCCWEDEWPGILTEASRRLADPR